MTKLEQLSERLNEIQLEMERRFGQIRTLLILLSAAITLSIGPHTMLGKLLADLVITK